MMAYRQENVKKNSFTPLDIILRVISPSVSKMSTAGVKTRPGLVCSAELVTSCYSLACNSFGSVAGKEEPVAVRGKKYLLVGDQIVWRMLNPY